MTKVSMLFTVAGIIQYKHRTTGLHRPWFMVDYNRSRHVPTGKVHEEIVLRVTKNWWRHPFLALVASGEVKRWIVATSNMRPGDIIRSHVDIPLIPVDPRNGDAHPVGALPVGTTVCLVELEPGMGAVRCRTAGTSATVIRRGKLVGDPTALPPSELSADNLNDLTDDHVVMLRHNGDRKLFRVLPNCMAVVGQVSNEDHNKQRYSKFGEKKWRGIKQRSGLWQRKTGRFGRKIYPIGPPLDYVAPSAPESKLILKYTRPEDAEYTRAKQRELHALLHPVPGKPRPQPVPREHNGLPTSQPLFRWCSWSYVR
ncbi:unnamed protein product [Echinostoma caproni]|uniref:Ribosomal_L2_C domain-containing protein n=1 Tax=Echinostoma caproni TaxID=27848 RepID=A0A183AJR3_9TREM|nr:unnamed protein product [Echinostoma caproni]